uniref:Uncharacterized protein n=1 Tax=Acrobeloides nanus TaxID=290746 RepID=A0A914ELN9_9BILA
MEAQGQSSSTGKNPLKNSSLVTNEENLHREFELALQEIFGSTRNPYMRRCQFRFVEQSPSNCAFEIKFMHPVGRSQFCALKMIFLIKNGSFDYVQFIAPHEEWTFSDYNQHQLDLDKESRYCLYRRLTMYGNLYLISAISLVPAAGPKQTIGNVIQVFIRLAAIFSTPCKVCKKILKDFMPPIVFTDIIRDPRSIVHESCR